MKFKTQHIAYVVRAQEGMAEVTVQENGEDRTTHTVYVSVKDSEEHLWVRGFTTADEPLPANDDVEVEMVEVTTGYSDGDMPADPALIMSHARIKAALVKLGFKVVDSMDRFF